MKRVLYLGRMGVAGYVLTVISETSEQALSAIRAFYDEAIENGNIFNVVPDDRDPLDWFGASAVEMELGKVCWL